MATENSIIKRARVQGLTQPGQYAGVVAAGATLTLTVAAHDGFRINLDTLAGSIVTLPASSGSGAKFTFVTTVIATSNSHVVQVANATDVFSGALNVTNVADGTCTAFGCVAASDTITLNRGTTGSAKVGEKFTVTDEATGFWSVTGQVIGTGAEATPFSAAVA